MFKHLLIATDGSTASQQGAVKAIELAKSLSARVTAITVSHPFPVFATDAAIVEDTSSLYEKECERRAKKSLAAVEEGGGRGRVCSSPGGTQPTSDLTWPSSTPRRPPAATRSAWRRMGIAA
jgi:nucleotide-binding universal stress UspA family protein